MKKERTLILIKPDGVVRNIVGKIIMRFEDSGLKIVGMKLVWVDENFAKNHYKEDIAKKHGEKVRNNLLKYIREGPVVAIVLEGADAINVTRKLVGSTYPNESIPGNIRGDFAHMSKDYAVNNEIAVKNLIHASENAGDAETEISLWFTSEEMHSYKTVHDIICFQEELDK